MYLKRLGHAICYFKKSLNVSSDQLDSKKTPNFVTETFSCRLLQRMVRMDMDWKKKKLGQLFLG